MCKYSSNRKIMMGKQLKVHKLKVHITCLNKIISTVNNKSLDYILPCSHGYQLLLMEGAYSN